MMSVQPSRPLPLHLAELPVHESARLHASERWLTVVLALWLVFLPWALGTMHVWAQAIALSLAALAFLLSLWPRPLPPLPGQTSPRRTAPWRMLFRAPAFWLTLMLFAYVAIQACNPQWVYRADATHWWLQKGDPVAWLPAGIRAPFAGMNAWRRLFIWGAIFLAACSAWLGVTHRRTLKLLLTTVAANAALVACLGLAQHFTHTKRIFWVLDFPGAAPFGSFVYKNHAAAFLLLGLCTAAGLAWRAHQRGLVHAEKSTPAGLFLLLGLLCFVAIAFSQSRFGLLLAAGIVLAFSARLGWQWVREGARRLPSLLLLATLLAGAIGILSVSSVPRLLHQEGSLSFMGEDYSVRLRVYAYAATARMLEDYPWCGIGAGGFRHLMPAYLGEFPFISQMPGFGPRGGMQVQYIALNESHSDILQHVAELGRIGSLPALGIMACAFAALSVRTRRQHPQGAAALLALGAITVYAWLDFPLHNPAVLGTLALLVVLGCRSADLGAPPVVTKSP